MRKNNGTTIDLTGQAFGLLTVVERAPNDKFGRVHWRCVCRCGAARLKAAHQLRAGKFFTCGAPACRFWEKVYIPETDSCWEWTGAQHDTGYGLLRVEGKNVRAHVFSWERENKKTVPTGLFVLHKCDVRLCVRPDHLFVGTHAENMQDMADKGRARVPKPRLSNSTRAGIKADRMKGFSLQGLAEKYGVSYATIQRVLQVSVTIGKDS